MTVASSTSEPIQNCWRDISEIPARTHESDQMSRELKKFGFSFAGSTVCYSFMQAVGMVNDHLVECFRYEPVRDLGQHHQGG